MAKVGKRSNVDADIDSSMAKKPKSSKKGDQPTDLRDVPDAEEDPGHSAVFPVAVKGARRASNAVVVNHTRAVEEQMQRLKNTVNEEAQKVTMRYAQLQASLHSIIADSRRGMPQNEAERPRDPGNERLAGPAIYQSGRSAIALSRELMSQYLGICEQTASREGPTKDVSERGDEVEALQRVLQKQGNKVQSELGRFIQGESNASTALPPDEVLAGDNDLWDRYAVTLKQGENNGKGKEHGWAVIAKHAQKGVHRIVRVLPDESER